MLMMPGRFLSSFIDRHGIRIESLGILPSHSSSGKAGFKPVPSDLVLTLFSQFIYVHTHTYIHEYIEYLYIK